VTLTRESLHHANRCSLLDCFKLASRPALKLTSSVHEDTRACRSPRANPGHQFCALSAWSACPSAALHERRDLSTTMLCCSSAHANAQISATSTGPTKPLHC
jgi:hypothetical protein